MKRQEKARKRKERKKEKKQNPRKRAKQGTRLSSEIRWEETKLPVVRVHFSLLPFLPFLACSFTRHSYIQLAQRVGPVVQ